MADVVVVCECLYHLGGHPGNGGVGKAVFSDHSPCANGYMRVNHYIIYDTDIGADIHIIANHCGFGQIAANGGELSHVHIVAYYCVGIDDQSQAMLDVEAVANLHACGDEEPIAPLVSSQHPFAQGVEKTFVLGQSPPEGEGHGSACDAVQIDA